MTRSTLPAEATSTRSPGDRRWARICLALVVVHLAMTALYLGPSPGPVRAAARSYMEPLFKQHWWVFAPDPVSRNTYLSVRGTRSDGTQTPWFGITRCDIDSAVLHHPVPDRRYLSTFQLVNHFRTDRDALPAAGRSALQAPHGGPGWWGALRSELVRDGATTAAANRAVKDDRVLADLASLVAEQRWGTGLRDVQVRIDEVSTRPFAHRHEETPLHRDTWTSGNRPFTPGTAAERETVDRLYGKAACR